MDEKQLIEQIRSRENLDLAFDYAVHDRYFMDRFYDPFELDYFQNNRDAVLDDLENTLRDLGNWKPGVAWTYYTAKTALVNRRMIYLPFRDLLVRYAFVIVLADLFDGSLGDRIFAGRRAQDWERAHRLYGHFASTSWPRFCAWQATEKKQGCMIRTDLTSFYDSISHDTLVTVLGKELLLHPGSEILIFFRRLLEVPVMGYDTSTRAPSEISVLRQGLPTGSESETFLANLYLSDTDAVMNASETTRYGRYVDDIRIFGKSIKVLLNAVRVLQENLSSRALNLNATKTRLCADREAIEKERSKESDVSNYGGGWEMGAPGEFAEPIAGNLDKSFDEMTPENEPDLPAEYSAPDEWRSYGTRFCFWINNAVEPAHVTRDHIQKLKTIAYRVPTRDRFVSWLLVRSATDRKSPKDVKQRAKNVILGILEDAEAGTYLRYRLLNHLTRLTRCRERMFVTLLSERERARLNRLIPSFVSEPAFELNLLGLYVARALGWSDDALIELVTHHAPNPLCEPLQEWKLRLPETGPARRAMAVVEPGGSGTETEVPVFAY